MAQWIKKGLGPETRPEEEIAARQHLDIDFASKHHELIKRLHDFDVGLQTAVSELIEYLRTGDVDFAAKAQAAIGGGTSRDIVEAMGYLSMLLMSADRQHFSRRAIFRTCPSDLIRASY